MINCNKSKKIPNQPVLKKVRLFRAYSISFISWFCTFKAQKKYTDRKQCKMSSSKKFPCKGTLTQVFICLRPPPLLDFCLGWSSNFVGSESGQIESVKLLQNMVSNTTEHCPAPTQPHTVCICCTLTRGRGGRGGGELYVERRLEGHYFTKLGRKY